MATTYKFQITMPQVSTLPRDIISHTFHMQHLAPSLTDLDNIAQDAALLFQKHYGGDAAGMKVTCKVYDMGAGPHVPKSEKTVGTLPWQAGCPREVALCLSFAKRANLPRERGRLYMSVGAYLGGSAISTITERPNAFAINKVLELYSKSNESLPDLGAANWTFGVYSPTNDAFYKTETAWVDNEWDTVRSRGVRATTRVSSTREG